MNAEGAGWSGISQIEIEVEDIFFLDIQFAGNHVHQQITLFQFIVDDAEDREHILLLAQLHAIVHLTVEVDSKIADLQQWALYMKKMCLGIHRILALHDDSTRQGQRTVEPGGHDRTTINFGIQFYDATLTEHLGIWLDAEGRGIAVSANHVEACIGKRLLSDLEGIDRRVVLGDKELVTSLNLAQWLLRIDAAETILLQFIRHVLDSQEIHWRSVKKG